MNIENLICEFSVLGKPQPRGSKKSIAIRNRATGKPVFRANGSILTATVDDNPESKHWMQQVAGEAIGAMGGSPMEEGPVGLVLVIELLRPKGHFGKRGLLPSAPVHPTVKPDSSKVLRGVEDAMTGIVYRDDSRIVRHVIEKRYAERQGVRVEVYRVCES